MHRDVHVRRLTVSPAECTVRSFNGGKSRRLKFRERLQETVRETCYRRRKLRGKDRNRPLARTSNCRRKVPAKRCNRPLARTSNCRRKVPAKRCNRPLARTRRTRGSAVERTRPGGMTHNEAVEGARALGSVPAHTQ